MEKEGFFSNSTGLNWQSSQAHAPPDMNSANHLPPCYLNLNWDQSIDQTAQFESALSSLVSSPSSNPPASTTPADNVVIRELIGRLGSICNSGEISPTSHYQSTTTSSCYSTPLNSPPKLNLSMMDHHQQHQLGRGSIPISGNPMPFTADPGFAERAARFSCFGARNYGQFGLQEAEKLSRVSSSRSLKAAGVLMGVSEIGKEMPMQECAQLENEMRSRFGSRLSGASTPEEGEFTNAQEESSASDRMVASGEASFRRGTSESNVRKRKAAPKGKAKEAPLSSSAANPSKVAEEEDSNAKRCRTTGADRAEKDVAVKPKAEQNGSGSPSGEASQKQGKENNALPPEPPKQDYIHVRARRGQATDSHSLAERVRREKISERMKFLQDLVPGCNKVTGKAVMLDEIINYVQSLQRQVEFLSMKLATVNPRLDFNMDSLLPKDMHQPRGPMQPHSVYPLESTSTGLSYGNQPQGTPLQSLMVSGLETQCSVNPLDITLRRTLSMQFPPLDGFVDAASQLGAFWEDDLQSVVQMGFGQNQENVFSSQSFQGPLPTNHMKIEL